MLREKLLRFLTLPYFPVIAAPFILFAATLLTGRTLFWGLPALQFIPWQAYAWQQLSQGMLPLWNPLNGMGAPLMANYQLALFYPPTWLGYLFAASGGVPAMAWAQTFLIPLHLAWAGVGMVRLAGRLGFGKLPQAIAGLAFGMGGYFVARSGFYSMIWAGAWLPWVIWAASAFAMPVKAENLSRKLIFPGLAVCIGMQLLAGHAQLSWYTIVLAGVWVLVGGWINGGWKGTARGACILAVNGLLGAGIAAVQLLPTAEYLLQSQRSSAVNFDSGLTYSFWAWRFLGLLAPNLFGNPGTGNFWGYASFWEDAVYLGVLPLALAVTTLRGIGRKINSDRWSVLVPMTWVLIGVGVLLALGKNTPLFPLLYRYVPTFSLFNAPARWMVWAVFGLALLAGVGAARWSRPVGKGLRRFRRMTFAAAAITVGAGAAWVLLSSVQVTFIEAAAFLGIWATGSCVLTLYKPRESGTPGAVKWEWAAVGWLVLDLVWAGWCLGPTVSASYFGGNQTSLPASQADGRVYLNGQDEYALKFKRFLRFEDYSAIEDWSALRLVGLPDLNLLPGAQFSYINNFDPIVPGRFARWMDWVDHLTPAQQTRVLPLMDVGSILIRDITLPAGASLQPAAGGERIRWTACASWVTDGESAFSEMVAELSSGGDRLAKTVVLEGNGEQVSAACDPTATGKITIQKEEPGKLTMLSESDTAGFLMIADTWYPGWVATIDGKATTVLRADYLFQGLSIEKGSHQVELRYSPQSVAVGAGLSLLVISALLIWGLTRQHRVQLHKLLAL
jgi:hypothetical protein